MYSFSLSPYSTLCRILAAFCCDAKKDRKTIRWGTSYLVMGSGQQVEEPWQSFRNSRTTNRDDWCGSRKIVRQDLQHASYMETMWRSKLPVTRGWTAPHHRAEEWLGGKILLCTCDAKGTSSRGADAVIWCRNWGGGLMALVEPPFFSLCLHSLKHTLEPW